MRFGPIVSFIFFLGIGLPIALNAQEQSPLAGFGIEANYITGKVLKHSPKFTLPIPDVSMAYDINFVFQTHGKRPWEQRRHYPVIGVGISYTNYGIDSIYGHAIG